MVIAGGLAHAFGGRQQQNLSLLAHQIVHGGRTLAGERNLALSRAATQSLRAQVPQYDYCMGGTAPNLSMRFVSAQFCAQTGRCRASCQLKTSRQAIQQLRLHFVAV